MIIGRDGRRKNDDDDAVLVDADDKLIISPLTAKPRNYSTFPMLSLLLMGLVLLAIMTVWISTTPQQQSHTTVVGFEEEKKKKTSNHKVGVMAGIRRSHRDGDVVFGNRHHDDILMTTSPTTNATFHIVYSTDCEFWES